MIKISQFMSPTYFIAFAFSISSISLSALSPLELILEIEQEQKQKQKQEQEQEQEQEIEVLKKRINNPRDPLFNAKSRHELIQFLRNQELTKDAYDFLEQQKVSPVIIITKHLPSSYGAFVILPFIMLLENFLASTNLINAPAHNLESGQVFSDLCKKIELIFGKNKSPMYEYYNTFSDTFLSNQLLRTNEDASFKERYIEVLDDSLPKTGNNTKSCASLSSQTNQ